MVVLGGQRGTSWMVVDLALSLVVRSTGPAL
jgi:hypothetical protein